jgi:hypothetical protein
MSRTQSERSQQTGHGVLVTGFEAVAEPGQLLGAGIVHRSRDQLVLFPGRLPSASPRAGAHPAHRRRRPGSAA